MHGFVSTRKKVMSDTETDPPASVAAATAADQQAKMKAMEKTIKSLQKENQKLSESLAEFGRKEENKDEDDPIELAKKMAEQMKDASLPGIIKGMAFTQGAAVNTNRSPKIREQQVQILSKALTNELIERACAQANNPVPQVNPEYGPPTMFGTGEASPAIVHHLCQAIKTKKSIMGSSQEMCLEDILETIRDTSDHYYRTDGTLLSRQGYELLLLTALPPEPRKDFRRFLKDQDSLESAWTFITMEHGSRNLPNKAQQLLGIEKKRLDRPYTETLRKIKSLAHDIHPSGNGVESAALDAAKEFFGEFLEETTIMHIFSFEDGLSTKQAWSTMNNIAGKHSIYIENKRKEALKKQKDEKNPPKKEQRTQELKAEDIALKVAEVFATQMQVASDRNPHAKGGATGYHYNGRDARGSTNRIRDRLPFAVYRALQGKCLLCGEGADPQAFHQWKTCPVYPNSTPMSSMCRCGKGLHAFRMCKDRHLWPQDDRAAPQLQYNNGQETQKRDGPVTSAQGPSA